MAMVNNMELVKDDLAAGFCYGGACRLNGGFPHVHGDRLDAIPLLGCQGRSEAIQTLLLPILGQIEHMALLPVRCHNQISVLRCDGSLIDAEVGHHPLGSTTQPSSDGSFLDPLSLVPGETQQSSGTRHRPLSEHVDGRALEPGSELAGIQMPPLFALSIAARDALLTLGTGIEPRSVLDGHSHLCPCYIQLHVGHGLRCLKLQHGLIEFEVSHRSAPPPKVQSLVRVELLTHTIS